jgi:hypothetical protein
MPSNGHVSLSADCQLSRLAAQGKKPGPKDPVSVTGIFAHSSCAAEWCKCQCHAGQIHD